MNTYNSLRVFSPIVCSYPISALGPELAVDAMRCVKVYDSEPEIRFFDTPIVVDNVAGEIVKD